MSTVVDEAQSPRGRRGESRARALLQTSAVRDAWNVFWLSRLLVWVTGCLSVLLLGVKSSARATFDPFHASSSLGALGNVLAGPAVRWDAIWYLAISHSGYPDPQTTGFFPLYPLLIHVVSWGTRSPVLAGVAISLVATFVGLVILHRLTELELGAEPARTTVALVAFAPFAFYLSAVYSEGLFLLLSAGAFYAARTGRWSAAGVLGGLAAMSRVTGVLLLAPVVLLFLYGPRTDAEPRPVRSPLMPRYPLSPKLLWSLLIPAGLAAFCAYTALKGYGFRAAFNAQHSFWQHRFVGPLAGVWDGILAASHQFERLLGGEHSLATKGPEMLEAGVLLMCAVGLIGISRRLPAAYGVYVLLGLLVPLSSPTVGEPLKGFARYASMMFPLFMWAGAWISERPRRRVLVCVSALLLIGFTLQFATWRYVGTMPF